MNTIIKTETNRAEKLLIDMVNAYGFPCLNEMEVFNINPIDIVNLDEKACAALYDFIEALKEGVFPEKSFFGKTVESYFLKHGMLSGEKLQELGIKPEEIFEPTMKTIIKLRKYYIDQELDTADDFSNESIDRVVELFGFPSEKDFQRIEITEEQFMNPSNATLYKIYKYYGSYNANQKRLILK